MFGLDGGITSDFYVLLFSLTVKIYYFYIKGF